MFNIIKLIKPRILNKMLKTKFITFSCIQSQENYSLFNKKKSQIPILSDKQNSTIVYFKKIDSFNFS